MEHAIPGYHIWPDRAETVSKDRNMAVSISDAPLYETRICDVDRTYGFEGAATELPGTAVEDVRERPSLEVSGIVIRFAVSRRRVIESASAFATVRRAGVQG